MKTNDQSPPGRFPHVIPFADAPGYHTPCDVCDCIADAVWTVNLGRRLFRLCSRCLDKLCQTTRNAEIKKWLNTNYCAARDGSQAAPQAVR